MARHLYFSSRNPELTVKFVSVTQLSLCQCSGWKLSAIRRERSHTLHIIGTWYLKFIVLNNNVFLQKSVFGILIMHEMLKDNFQHKIPIANIIEDKIVLVFKSEFIYIFLPLKIPSENISVKNLE